MKKIIVITMLLGIVTTGVVAQDDHSKQNVNKQAAKSVTPAVSQLLSSYYGMQRALAGDNAKVASIKAAEFVKAANAIDYKVVSERNISALLKDAGKIAGSADINLQRKHFISLSENMVLLAKAMKLSQEPVYQAYCPMKKANWLTAEKSIKNPYYGSSMLNCGSITDTIQ